MLRSVYTDVRVSVSQIAGKDFKMIRIIIADDQLLFRSMLEEMLKRDDGIQIVFLLCQRR